MGLEEHSIYKGVYRVSLPSGVKTCHETSCKTFATRDHFVFMDEVFGVTKKDDSSHISWMQCKKA